MRFFTTINLALFVFIASCGVEENSSELDSVNDLIVNGTIAPRFVFDQTHINGYNWTTQRQAVVGEPRIYPPASIPGPAVNWFQTGFAVSSGERLPTFRVKHSAPGSASDGQRRMSLIGSDMRIRGMAGTSYLFDMNHPLLNEGDLFGLRTAGITSINVSAKFRATHVHETLNSGRTTYLRIECNPGPPFSSKVLKEFALNSTTTSLNMETGIVDFNVDRCIETVPGNNLWLPAKSVSIKLRVQSIDAIFYDYLPIVTTNL
ncbi:MAG: hypothetical protein HRU19_11290 [Pseudobacteriovorax sp.]|nr:hypothetical protein [Pseudobacteriovorax sp.]